MRRFYIVVVAVVALLLVGIATAAADLVSRSAAQRPPHDSCVPVLVIAPGLPSRLKADTLIVQYHPEKITGRWMCPPGVTPPQA